MPDSTMPLVGPRVFLSHSSKDKEFVRKLADSLTAANLNVWIDERELNVGDSIVEGINDALKNTDYLVPVFSVNSVQSQWVQQEISSALMSELSGKGVAVLPVRIDDTPLPPLLVDRIYADFRVSYEDGLNRLISALRQESESVGSPALVSGGSSCVKSLEKLSKADLRRKIDKCLDDEEVEVVWYDTFSEKIGKATANQQKPNVIIDLIDRADRRSVLGDLLKNLCTDYPHIANP